MRPSSGFAIAGLTFLGLVMLKDGTLGKLVGNIATGVQTTVSGLTPLTKVG